MVSWQKDWNVKIVCAWHEWPTADLDLPTRSKLIIVLFYFIFWINKDRDNGFPELLSSEWKGSDIVWVCGVCCSSTLPDTQTAPLPDMWEELLVVQCSADPQEDSHREEAFCLCSLWTHFYYQRKPKGWFHTQTFQHFFFCFKAYNSYLTVLPHTGGNFLNSARYKLHVCVSVFRLSVACAHMLFFRGKLSVANRVFY